MNYSENLAQLINGGWEMVSEGPSGAQLKKPRAMATADKVCFVAGVFGLVIYGLGIVLILIAALDYAFFTKEKTHFLSRDNPEMPSDGAPAKKRGFRIV